MNEDGNPAENSGRQANLIDSHCHLHDLDDPDSVWQQAKLQGVSGAICIGTDVPTSRAALALATRLGQGVWASVGLHPHDASLQGEAGIDGIETLLREHQGDRLLVALGECGLDYYYERSPRAVQKEAFLAQIELAKRYNLTLVIHARDAWTDIWSLLRSCDLPERIVFHCFTGGVNEARTCLDLGAWLSFSGIATFPSASDVRQAAVFCPADRILVETDSPFLTPVPHRGVRNEPAMVRVVAEHLAKQRGQNYREFAELTFVNTVAAFSLTALHL